MLKLMNAKYRGLCAGTGRTIHRGDEIAYDTTARKAYGVGTAEHSKAKGLGPTQDRDQGGDMLLAMQEQAADAWYAEQYPNG